MGLKDRRKKKKKTGTLRVLMRQLGPGLITGAADDDPSGIATYAQIGAQFGYGLAWTVVLTTPLMAAVQEISARLGRVTGAGLGAAMRTHLPRTLTLMLISALVIANVINLGADIGAMAAAVRLLIGGPELVYAVLIALLCAGCEIWFSYRRYVLILKWLTLALFAYVALLFVVHPPMGEVLRGAFIPTVALTRDGLTALVAVLGTTISPYLFFWQASEEAEDESHEKDPRPLREHTRDAPKQMRRIEIDTYVGMIFSNAIALSIMVGTAATLHAAGTTQIKTAADAAMALTPVAGSLATTFFALGILGTGLLAVPVLAGSAAYAIGEASRWKVGLSRLAWEARAFYGVIVVSTGLGLGMVFLPIEPMKALFWSAVINGAVSAPMIVAMVVLGSRTKIMGALVLPWSLRIMGLFTAAVMGGATITMLVM